MKVIIHKETGRVVAYGTAVQTKPNGLLCGGIIYAEAGLEVVDFVGEVTPYKHLLKNGIVTINPEFEMQESEIKSKAKEELALDIANDGVKLKETLEKLYVEGKVTEAKITDLTTKLKLTTVEKDAIVKK